MDENERGFINELEERISRIEDVLHRHFPGCFNTDEVIENGTQKGNEEATGGLEAGPCEASKKAEA